MKQKMKVFELASKSRELDALIKRELDYVEKCGGVKFPPKISIAIAKNAKAFAEELKVICEQENKNEQLAEKKGVKLSELPEQKELLNTDVELEICTIKAADVEASQVTAADVLALMFMTEEGGN